MNNNITSNLFGGFFLFAIFKGATCMMSVLNLFSLDIIGLDILRPSHADSTRKLRSAVVQYSSFMQFPWTRVFLSVLCIDF